MAIAFALIVSGTTEVFTRSAVRNVKRIFIYDSAVPVWPSLAVSLSYTDAAAVYKTATAGPEKRASAPKAAFLPHNRNTSNVRLNVVFVCAYAWRHLCLCVFLEWLVWLSWWTMTVKTSVRTNGSLPSLQSASSATKRIVNVTLKISGRSCDTEETKHIHWMTGNCLFEYISSM